MPDQRDDMLELERANLWLGKAVEALVLRLGGEVTLTSDELRGMLERDSSWQPVGPDYRIMVR